MSDKLRDLFPVNVTFSAGEQPSAEKLTNWARQTNSALNLVSLALGDLWGDSYPVFSGSSNTPIGGWAFNKSGTSLGSEQRHLQILNLARLMGPASALNPRILSDNTATITGESVPANVNEFYLEFIPESGTLTFSNGTQFATETTEGGVSTTGKYYVDYSTGRVVVWDTGSSPGTATYDVDVSASYMGDTYEGARFNVIPDPNQSTKCTVSGPTAGKYTIAFPTVTDQQANWDDTSTTLSAVDDLNYLAQLNLPEYFSNEYTAGDQIAEGLVGLWDGDSKVVLPNVTFFYVSQTSIQVSVNTGVTLEVGSDRYSLCVVGVDITRTLDSLRSRYRKHRHDGTNGSQRIKHGDLDQLAHGGETLNSFVFQFTPYTTGTGDRVDHPQYLYRGNPGLGDTTLNAMLTDFRLASDTPPTGVTPFSTTSDSFGIYFGSQAYVHYAQALDVVTFKTKGVRVEKTFRVDEGLTALDGIRNDGSSSSTLWQCSLESGSVTTGPADDSFTVSTPGLSGKNIYGVQALVKLQGGTEWLAPGDDNATINGGYSVSWDTSSNQFAFYFTTSHFMNNASLNYRIFVTYSD